VNKNAEKNAEEEQMNREDVKKVIKKLDLVENISNPRMLKVSGQDLNFARYVDEFSGKLISEIPNIYNYLNILLYYGGNNREEVNSDVKEYLDHLETLLAVYLEESELKGLAND
jgi:hypothetical protein